MDWARDGADWPNRDASRFVEARPHRWHVQVAGQGPTILLLHGAGGATHSWRDLFPLLARRFHVVAPDLPGQGFTRAGGRSRLGLPTMAEDLWSLCAQEGWAPVAIVGHSAGGAIMLQMALTRGRDAPLAGLIGINPALADFSGAAEWLFPLMARGLAATPFVPRLFSRISGSPARVTELLSSTGSRIDDRGRDLYLRLVRDPAHVEGVLGMMASWKTRGLASHLHRVDLPVVFIAGGRDGTVPPRVAADAARRIPRAEVVMLHDLGHLAHEEASYDVAEVITERIKEI